ncbi:uncharacterized protein LOC124135651 [Haliotis rufescens]|uniref:uncharacterized protein LOC124135651 n=1 Tax=Haliotis rufescens TaxID=6454 RepID=UPI00201E852B|nr:uncharacterized protein LOC124135651 [Haliotis rufescens]XP_048244380.1 uncharacterized protein LOC124135651 [Haliotis rufescens]
MKKIIFLVICVTSLPVYFFCLAQMKNVISALHVFTRFGTKSDKIHTRRASPSVTRTIQQDETTRPNQYGVIPDVAPPMDVLVDKYIIYDCNYVCGGLADRQKGIITSYLVSQMLKRNFGLSMKRPCEFSNFVIPNLVEWRVEKTKLKGRSHETKRSINSRWLGQEMKHKSLETMYDKDVTFYMGNIDYVPSLMQNPLFSTVKWAQNKSHHDIYRIAFSQLFRFSPNTQSKFDSFNAKEERASKTLICAHLRMGKSNTIPSDDAKKSRPDLDSLVLFLQKQIQFADSCRLFIATDSDEARVVLKRAFPEHFLEIEGQIVHIDQPHGGAVCSGMEKAILDEYILSTCDTLIMSRSGFSRMAAVVRGSDEGLFCATQKNITRSKRLNPT